LVEVLTLRCPSLGRSEHNPELGVAAVGACDREIAGADEPPPLIAENDLGVQIAQRTDLEARFDELLDSERIEVSPSDCGFVECDRRRRR
jgi:hypothetical protein